MSETTPDNNERNPFTRPGFILSAALVIALIAAVLVIAFLPNNDEPGTAAPSPSAPASTPVTPEGGTEESVCGLPGNDDTALGAAPESDWELLGTMAVPTAPETAGPGAVEEGLRSCFAQTPTGALYAATNILATGFYGDTATVYRELTADSPVRDAALEAIENGEAVGGGEAPKIQVAGFLFRSYTDDSAVVDLAFRTEDGGLGSTSTALVWEDGDWKQELPQNGRSSIQQIADLSDFIPWGGA